MFFTFKQKLNAFTMHIQFANKNILITAGATRELLDNYTYISNNYNPVQEYALANYLLHQGANVVMVTAPSGIDLQHPNLKTIQVNTALEMDAACCQHYDNVDIAVFGAKVATYRAEKQEVIKLKNTDNTYCIKMVKNIDIAYEFGKVKKTNQMSVGITTGSNPLKKAIGLLDEKNFDVVVANEIDETLQPKKLTIIDKSFTQTEVTENNTTTIAKNIAQVVQKAILNEKNYCQSQLVY
jgi:phosphopantothenoylcysteine decarboxylase / phosphopantothenate---cysteine ligase